MHAAYRVEEPRTFLTASHGMRRLGDKAGGTDKRERERGTNNFPRTVRPRFFCHPRERRDFEVAGNRSRTDLLLAKIAPRPRVFDIPVILRFLSREFFITRFERRGIARLGFLRFKLGHRGVGKLR